MPHESFHKDNKNIYKSNKNEDQRGSIAKTNKRQWKTTFEPSAAVGGTISIDIFYAGRPGALLPCLPSPSYFRPPRFTLYTSCCPPSRHSLGHHPRRMRCGAYSPCVILVPPHHEPFGCFKDPPVILFLVFFAAVDHSAVSTPNTKEESSVDPSVAQWLPQGSMPGVAAQELSRIFPRCY